MSTWCIGECERPTELVIGDWECLEGDPTNYLYDGANLFESVDIVKDC
jgi:hypothetical protein